MRGSSSPSCPPGARADVRGRRGRRPRLAAPADALDAMADGRLAMWLPTSTTLQQLEHVAFDRGDPRAAGARPARRDRGRGALARGDPDRHAGRWRRGRAAGLRVPRRAPPVRARRSGRPDRSGARSRARARGGARRRRSRPSRSPMSTRTMPPAPRPWPSASGSRSSPVRAAAGRCRTTVRELADLELLDAGDVGLRAILTPGPRPDHVAYLAGDGGVRPRPATSTGARGARVDPRPAGRRRPGRPRSSASPASRRPHAA